MGKPGKVLGFFVGKTHPNWMLYRQYLSAINKKKENH
jgi:hypothetical protein